MYSKIYIPHQLPGEKIVIILRRHWLIFFRNVAIIVILFAVPLPLLWFAQNYFPGVLIGQLLRPFFVILFSIYYLLIWLLFYTRFIDLYLDVWIVTNKRIINIEQHGLFSRVEAEHRLERVQDISSEVHGFMETIFNFGNIHIQTAGEKQRFVFKQVPQPYYIKKLLSDITAKSKRELQDKTGGAI